MFDPPRPGNAGTNVSIRTRQLRRVNFGYVTTRKYDSAGFNPHPPITAGEFDRLLYGCCLHVNVSIRTRQLRRVNLAAVLKDKCGINVSIRTRQLRRVNFRTFRRSQRSF